MHFNNHRGSQIIQKVLKSRKENYMPMNQIHHEAIKGEIKSICGKVKTRFEKSKEKSKERSTSKSIKSGGHHKQYLKSGSKKSRNNVHLFNLSTSKLNNTIAGNVANVVVKNERSGSRNANGNRFKAISKERNGERGALTTRGIDNSISSNLHVFLNSSRQSHNFNPNAVNLPIE